MAPCTPEAIIYTAVSRTRYEQGAATLGVGIGNTVNVSWWFTRRNIQKRNNETNHTSCTHACSVRHAHGPGLHSQAVRDSGMPSKKPYLTARAGFAVAYGFSLALQYRTLRCMYSIEPMDSHDTTHDTCPSSHPLPPQHTMHSKLHCPLHLSSSSHHPLPNPLPTRLSTRTPQGTQHTHFIVCHTHATVSHQV